MLLLALQATLPVGLGILAAGLLAARFGQRWLWLTLLATLALSVLAWGLPWGSEGQWAQRFLAPIAVYAPPLLLGGITLALIGSKRWRVPYVLPIAAGWAAANILIAQFTFMAGCAAGAWDCP